MMNKIRNISMNGLKPDGKMKSRAEYGILDEHKKRDVGKLLSEMFQYILKSNENEIVATMEVELRADP